MSVLDDAALERLVSGVHRASGATYGVPRIRAALQILGIRVGPHRLARAMRVLGLRGERARAPRTREGSKSRARIHRDEQVSRRCSRNHVRRRFRVGSANHTWLVDGSVVPTTRGLRMLVVVLDVFSRRIVGWTMGHRETASVAARALTRAFRSRRPAPGVIVHTDRGGAFASHHFESAIRARAACPSMSRRGNCWDNAPVESFFATLKSELLYRCARLTPAAAIASIGEYIEWYNTSRLHSSLGYVSPAVFESRYAT
ncbi:MAG: IS3 family transposase [Myxococcota bacterium]